MSHAFDFLVFIGRFQPFHLGHLAVVQAGLQQAKHLIVLCGSAGQPRSLRNPFTWQERAEMIRAAVNPVNANPLDATRLLIAPVADSPYHDERWISAVQSAVQSQVASVWSGAQAPRIGLIGHALAGSSYFPDRFPQWPAVSVVHRPGISATLIRQALLNAHSGPLDAASAALVPLAVQQWLATFSAGEACQDLREEQAFVSNYRKGWEVAPYEPNFVTVDAAVVQSGHILLIERGRRPGKGLLALPGGFLDPGERILDACLRELHEETGIAVPLPELRAAIRRTAVYDAPHRSARARTITHAFLVQLEPGRTLPTVTASDDARAAHWVPLAALDPERMFEDHYFIIQDLLGL